MKAFHFKQFSINQSSTVFRVGTDGVLLGASASVSQAHKILEIGSGTGLISLMLAQRNSDAEILAIDLNADAVHISAQNFNNSPFESRLRASHQDLKEFESTGKFDLIVSNPPYFDGNQSSKDVIARQQTELTFDQLIKKSSHLLTREGILSVIIPFEAGIKVEKHATLNRLFLHRKQTIYGMVNSKPKRLLLEFGFTEKEIKYSDFVIEKAPRIYTEQYLELTKDFHIFSK